ncbi:MAG: hypothetical protein LC798_11770 [Chloroflexi bacterium]|nr:hypothetical protein [Chloroflexota bacterium]
MRRLLPALVFLACVLGGPLTAAQAGTYVVWACADGQGNALSAGDWSPSTAGTQALATSTCGSNTTGSAAGSMQAITGGGPGQPDSSIVAAWNLAAAPGTKITGLDIWWSNSATIQVPGRVAVIAGAKVLYFRDTGAFGSPTAPFGDANLLSCSTAVPVANRLSCSGLSESTAAMLSVCVTGCARPDRALASLFNTYRTKTTVTDATAPTGEVTGVTEGMAITGPVAIGARASDVGGGVRDVQLVVDGQVVESKQSTRASCQDIDSRTGDANEYAAMKPCLAQLPDAAEAPFTFTLALAQLATPGAHTVSVIAHDAAGNPGTLSSNQVIVTPVALDGPAPPSRYDKARNLFFNPDANAGAAGVVNGVNGGAANIQLAFPVRQTVRRGGKAQRVTRFVRRRVIGYNTVVRARGTLTNPAGVPITQARVYRALSVAGGPWRLDARPLITSAKGRVIVKLPARSPNRRVQLLYFPTTDSNGSFRSPALGLSVRAPVSLSFSRSVVPRGGRVNVTARLRAGRRPGRSVLGALQVRKGRGWQTIRQLRFKSAKGGRGVATVALRLSNAPKGTGFRFRAFVGDQSSLRYTKGASRTRVVRIR